jgi:hypothetical protein
MTVPPWPTKPITSPEALLSCNKTAILWGDGGSKVVGDHLLPVPLTCRLMREIPGRGDIESVRWMRVSEPLLISDSAGEPIGLHLAVVELMAHFVARTGAAERRRCRNECPRNDTLERREICV